MGSLGKRLYQLLREAGAEQAPEVADDSSVAPPPLACSAGPLTRISPGLHVNDSAVKLPLDAEHAATIKAAGGDGKCGIWEVPAAKLQITDPRWESEVVTEAVRRSKAALTISPDTVVEARLKRLELRQAKSRKIKTYLSSHQASPKGAFGELAILLPSSYQGGQVLVLHGQREVQIDLAARNAKSSCFAAFLSGGVVYTQPITAGQSCMLVYDLVWTGGPKPPALAQDLETRLLSLARVWNRQTAGCMKLCYLLKNRYSASALQEHGLEALKGADKKTAQLLASAWERGAELDVCLALIKATGEPGMTRDDIFQWLYDEEDGEPLFCPDCGEFHMGAADEDEVRDVAEEAYHEVLYHNQGYYAHKRVKWISILAGKLAPLAGPQPPFHHTSLDAKSELLCSKDYWRRDPDRVFEDSEDEDEDGPFVRQQFRRAGLLIWPRSKRLLNAVHADLPQQTLRLSSMLYPDDQGGGSSDVPESSSTAVRPTERAVQALQDVRHWALTYHWCQHDDMFRDYDSDSCDGYSDAEQPDTTAPELGDQIIRYLADTSVQRQFDEVGSLRMLLQLAPNPAVVGRLPGDGLHLRRATKLLNAAADRSRASYCPLGKEVAALLKHWGWDPLALPALRRWARCDSASFSTATELLDSITADAASAVPEQQSKALAAASAVALSLAKALRQGTLPAHRAQMYDTFARPHKMLVALQRLPTAAGQLALESAVESVLDRYRGAVLERHRKPALQAADAWGMELQLLHAACTSILQSLPPATIGGNAALLKLACSCLSALAVSIGEKPEPPGDWTKATAATVMSGQTACPFYSSLQAFLLDAQQREATTAATFETDQWIETFMLVMRIPALADIQVKRIEPEDGGPASWLLTKRHFAYEQALSQYDQRCALLRSLQDLLLPCLVLAVPRSSSSSLARLGGAVGGTQPPPAKVRRRSSSRR